MWNILCLKASDRTLRMNGVISLQRVNLAMYIRDPEYGILDPYDDDAASRLTAFGAFIDWVRGDQQAEITVTKLRLNRLDLVSSRIDRLNHVRSLIERWHDSEGALKATLEQVISVEAREGEFSASACALLRSHRFPL
jgi:hypothetical protein